MVGKIFTKDFTRQEPICEEAIGKALEVLRSGKLHRYNIDRGEKSEAALLEEEFAVYMGKKYCLACASCGSAMYLALKSLGVGPGDKVLCNSYTLAPVPGAIENAGADIEIVEITDDYTIDLDDLINKAGQAKWLMLSHMRGHIADMERVMEICKAHNLTLIEDCAHTISTPGKVDCWSPMTPMLSAEPSYFPVPTCSTIGIQHALDWKCLNLSRPWCPTIPAAWTISGPPY
ncbi:MAG: aminotransferase class I/II-fold pyridoxal phosphate-dependent enzyme [Desulfofustis sp.]